MVGKGGRQGRRPRREVRRKVAKVDMELVFSGREVPETTHWIVKEPFILQYLREDSPTNGCRRQWELGRPELDGNSRGRMGRQPENS